MPTQLEIYAAVRRPEVGDRVLYALRTREGVVHRPAVVVRVWYNNLDARTGIPIVNLQVFTDGSNDSDTGSDTSAGIVWKTSVHYDDSRVMDGTWMWPLGAAHAPAPPA